MILVPKDTPGVHVVRSTSLFGYDDGPHGGHAEIVYDDVRVPAANLLGEEGEGFRLAQERLGPGRIHHAMRAIGMAERALEMMCRRTAGRSTFGSSHRPRRRPALDLRGAREDRAGAPARAQDRVADGHRRQPRRAHRGVGDQGRRARGRDLGDRSRDPGPRRRRRLQDILLAELYAVTRILQIADGPDEVHHMAIAAARPGGTANRSQSDATASLRVP